MSILACSACGTVYAVDDKACRKCGKTDRFEVGGAQVRTQKAAEVDDTDECLGCQ